MAYVECRTKAGYTIEVERYYTPRHYPKGERRRKRCKVSSEAQKKINNRQAVRKLRRLINANFRYQDWHIDMGYVRHEGELRDKEQMREDMAKFLRKLRKLYKKAGQQLKYIHIMEVGERGSRHHHMILNHAKGIDTGMIQQAWNEVYEGRSFIHFSPLDRSGNYGKLASYLVKYTEKTVGTDDALMQKRWSCSRNLVRPVTVKKVISRYDVLREPTAVAGYCIDKQSIEHGYYAPEYGGFEFVRYILVRVKK